MKGMIHRDGGESFNPWNESIDYFLISLCIMFEKDSGEIPP